MKKEFEFKGVSINGFAMLVVIALLIAGGVLCFVNEKVLPGLVAIVVSICLCIGFRKLEPNEGMVMLFFGKYRGTFTKTGFYWVNFLLTSKKVSLRARNLNPDSS